MECKQFFIIPEYENCRETFELAQQYHCGLEYQDFFQPDLLDNTVQCEKVLGTYETNAKETCDTMLHGVFLDIMISSDDAMIRKVSDMRVEDSLQKACRLGVRGVIFHTNYISNFNQSAYRENWLERNVQYWTEKLEKYKNLEIYIENMFDDSPVLIARLAQRMQSKERFGICFDYAHANVFGKQTDLSEWVTILAPYVKYLHINDNDLLSDLHLPLGSGKIDWSKFKRYYEQYFSNCPVLIEVSGLQKIQESLEYINAL